MGRRARKNTYGEGSSSVGGDKFEAIVYPDKDDIEIPKQFVLKWKETICSTRDACLKDPSDNFFNFDTKFMKQRNIIPLGKKLAEVCGFDKPQMVIFEYLPEDNQFNMRFVDDNGNDIVATNSRRGEYIYTICETHTGGGVAYCPYNWTLMIYEATLAATAEAGQDAINDEKTNGFHFNWEKVVTQNFAEGKSVLHFPSAVNNASVLHDGQEILVVNDEKRVAAACNVRQSSTRDQEIPRFYLGVPFYDVIKKLNLEKDDKLLLALNNPPTALIVKVVRRGEA